MSFSQKNEWLLLQSGPCGSAFNMALDQAMLEAVPRLGKPVLRFYGWTESAASFGYFQRFSEVEKATLLRPLVRRPTGGGIVPHDADWTYSLVFPTSNEWHSLRAETSYRRVHEWIQTAFARLDVQTELAPGCRKAAPGQCFAGHEKSDVLWRGKKIAGAAQRRTKAGLLIQGSVQPPHPSGGHPLPHWGGGQGEGERVYGPDARPELEVETSHESERPLTPSLSPDEGEGGHTIAGPGDWATESLAKMDWQQAMCDVAVRDFGTQWSEFELDTALREQAERLTLEKYSQPGYNRKR